MSVTSPTVTGWSSFWSMTGDFNAYAPLNNQSPANGGLLGWRSKLEWQIAKLMNRNQYREQKALWAALLGVAPGATALKTYQRVNGPAATEGTGPFGNTGVGDLGGLVPIETVTVINRATLSSDVTYLTSIVNNDMLARGLTYAVDLSGNGAGFGGKNSEVGW